MLCDIDSDWRRRKRKRCDGAFVCLREKMEVRRERERERELLLLLCLFNRQKRTQRLSSVLSGAQRTSKQLTGWVVSVDGSVGRWVGG